MLPTHGTCAAVRTECPCPSGRAGESGVALPGVLLVAAFLVGVSGWMIGHVRTDVAIASAQEDEAVVARLASAAIQMVAMALARVTDWQPVPALALDLPCAAGIRPAVPVDADAERAWLQSETDAGTRWGADTPRWHLLWACQASAVHGRWPAPGPVPVVLVWVADDPEGDGQPLRSANQRLWLHAVARGPGLSRGAASLTMTRTAPGRPVILEAWRGAPGS